jgi:cytochrome c oxidase assembly protein subunit 15
MLHRIAAGLFVLSALAAAAFAAQSAMARVRAWAFAGAALALLQVGLGIANVLWRMPVPLREAHAANAAVTFIVFVIATFLAMIDPIGAPAPTRKGLSMRRAV